MVLMAGIFLAMSPNVYRHGVMFLFPPRQREEIRQTLDYSGSALQLWLVGQLVAMVIVGALTAIGLSLIGLPSALGLGLIAGLFEFIPIVGPFLGAATAVLLASSQGWQMVLWTIGVFAVVQQLESNMITPMIQRRAVSLPPALLLFAVLAFGTLFGPLGVLFASPLTVIVYVAIKKLYVEDVLGEETHIPGAPKTHHAPH
jgi:predicted PurR-regulated permease PerM